MTRIRRASQRAEKNHCIWGGQEWPHGRYGPVSGLFTDLVFAPPPPLCLPRGNLRMQRPGGCDENQ